jgi:hypothetical protein
MLNRFQRSLPTPRLTFAARHTNALSSEKNGALWNDAPVRGKWHLQLSRAAASVVPLPVASFAANGR